MIKKYNRHVWSGLMLLVSLGVLTLITNIITTMDLRVIIDDMYHHPMHIILDGLVIVFVFSSIRCFTNVSISMSTTVLLSTVLSLINRMKLSMRGLSLIPSDFLLVKEFAVILPSILDKYVYFSILIILISTTLVYKIFNRYYDKRVSLFNRGTELIIAIIIGGVLFCSAGTFDYSTGFIYNFTISILKIDAENYDIDVKEKEFFIANEKYETSDLKPNIVVIMNESFWNPKLLEGLEFNKNPIANFESLQKEAIYGYLESPEFGGGTSNVEFEFLTGYSTHFYRPGYLLYPKDMSRRKVPTLVGLLKNQGYTARAIHSFNGWYYKRNEVYENFGFDEFISKEVLDTAVTKGLYISDEYVSDVIIDILKSTTGKSQFIFASTMQNHGPYNDNRYGIYRDRIRVKHGSEIRTKQVIETYAQGVYDADRALGKLVNYLRDFKEPTVVLFFGDHLPLLGENLSIYKDYGFYDELHDSKLKLYSVPFVLWSNYKNDNKDLGTINVSFIGSKLLKFAELQLNDYFKFLDRLGSKIAVISRTYAVDDKGVLFKADSELYMKYNEIYKQYQFKEMNSLK